MTKQLKEDIEDYSVDNTASLEVSSITSRILKDLNQLSKLNKNWKLDSTILDDVASKITSALDSLTSHEVDLIQERLEAYLNDEYDNYQYGNPKEAAAGVIEAVAEIQKDIQELAAICNKAGSFLSPAMKAEAKRRLHAAIDRLE